MTHTTLIHSLALDSTTEVLAGVAEVELHASPVLLGLGFVAVETVNLLNRVGHAVIVLTLGGVVGSSLFKTGEMSSMSSQSRDSSRAQATIRLRSPISECDWLCLLGEIRGIHFPPFRQEIILT